MTSAEHSKVVVLLLLIHCVLLPPLFCGEFIVVPCYVVHCFCLVSLGQSAGCFTLIVLKFHFMGNVLYLFFMTPLVCLQCVIVGSPVRPPGVSVLH